MWSQYDMNLLVFVILYDVPLMTLIFFNYSARLFTFFLVHIYIGAASSSTTFFDSIIG